ncbi:hypothetical protein ACIBI4_25580 [Streptomyces sp. NPDC050418]|uniref:hypothetical protein n=1 Tax=Streptomyces sp. NPDC050418 TaxID=3365612 RepID=UPI0037B0F2A5
MISGDKTFLSAVTTFEQAVRQQDSEAAEQAFNELARHYGGADESEYREAAPRLAALLPGIPPGPRSHLAVLTGACVEHGADAAACAPHIFAGAREAFDAAAEFCTRWSATGGTPDDLPDPEEGLNDEIIERTGLDTAIGWCTLPQWEMASVAMLNSQAVRKSAPGKPELLAAAERVTERSGHDFKCLTYALRALDDEPVIVLHRATGAGFALRISGIGDNFQLHTLLAGALIAGGHLPGRAPSAEEIAVCRDAPGQVQTTGSFNLVDAAGQWIWNEGCPDDIPTVDGARLIVLDPPPYERGWAAGRFFPGMYGNLALERVLAPQEAADWLAKAAPDRQKFGNA